MNNEKTTLVQMLNEDPATCPRCGSRTDFKELPEGRQFHECLNSDCQYEFIGMFEPEEKQPLNKSLRSDER